MGRYPEPLPPPGWYDDGGLQRWFNGLEWTDRYKAPPRKSAFPMWARIVTGTIGAAFALMLLLLATDAISLDNAFQKERDTGRDTAAIGSHVRESMQGTLDTDPKLAPYGLRVTRVSVVHSAGNEYKGIATVWTRGGDEHDVLVSITDDGTSTLWSAAPGSFMFLLGEEPGAIR